MAQERTVLDALTRRAKRADSRETLAQLASEIGHAVAGQQLDAEAGLALSRVVARTRRGREAYDEGYLTGLSDLVAAVAAARADTDDRAASTRAVDASRALQDIVRVLDDGPKGPSAIAHAIGLEKNDGRVTRHLQKLEQLGLVVPARSANQKERLRQLTARGHRIASGLPAPAGVAASLDPDQVATIVEGVVRMLHLVMRCREVSLAELAASSGSTCGDSLARELALRGERQGLLDLTKDDRCSWLRTHEWARVLEGYASRSDLLQRAFAEVPRGFVLLTDEVDAWRNALRSSVDGVQDVLPFNVSDRELDGASAVVSTDETIAESLASEIPVGLFAATQRNGEVFVEPIRKAA